MAQYAATLFFDVGGVILTNGWDTAARRRAAERFQLDWHDFQTRHEMLKTALEVGRLSLDDYLRRAVFYRPRDYTVDEFKAFMFDQSQPLPASLDYVRALAATGRYRLSTLNNESRELNDYRIRTFHLDQIFVDFFTSCYLGVTKPDEAMYLNVLAITRCPPDRAIFIDDRLLNVEPALTLGLAAVHYQDPDQLRRELAEQGIDPAAGPA